ncbi:type III secretion system chaperone [Pelagibius sp.]|uniref:type III secretion system chaperone n=1 Tax=Pelagibius sp. TaxID=1931238 RepID=UPI00261640E4|nr:type III secretion system chaperone [Pelagibius sp.]
MVDARLRDLRAAEKVMPASDKPAFDKGEVPASDSKDRIGVEVEAPHGAGIFVVYARVGPLPENPAAAADLLVKAMASNLCLAATGGGSLGLDARSGMLVLSYIEESRETDRERLAEVVALCRRKTAELRGRLLEDRHSQNWISI